MPEADDGHFRPACQLPVEHTAPTRSCNDAPKEYCADMFTIEHEFDASVITLIDEGNSPLREDVTVQAFASVITIEQWDPRTNTITRISLSPGQFRDLTIALNLPEGIYRTTPES